MNEVSIPIGDTTLKLQFDRFASKADHSVFAQIGETCVMATLVAGSARADIDYFPLYIDYVEKLYAGGRIKGSRWVKREGKPSDEAVLTRRLIDRGIRPLFPKEFKREVQIIITLLSLDGVNSPEIVSAIAASALLSISGLPWQGPISTVRVGYIVGEGTAAGNLVINPSEEVQDYSVLDLVVTSGRDRVVMIETQAKIIPDKVIYEGIEMAIAENNKIITAIEAMQKQFGTPKETVAKDTIVEEVKQLINKSYTKEIDMILAAFASDNNDKILTTELVKQIAEAEGHDFDKGKIAGAVFEITREKIRTDVLKNKKRFDGRAFDEIRELHGETSVLPRTHGSALFKRGSTEVMSIATLGSPTMEQLIEGPEGQESKRYIHHYYSPPYSYGEVGRTGWPSPREIGHGALAEKALEPVIPTEQEFPYTIQIVSEVLTSNGSTSMASTCGSTLALMDAGVPIKAPVAGISVGLVWESDTNYELLTDIAGIEDFVGDMDFKIAGTESGITAIQLDVKNTGLTSEMIGRIFEQSLKARMQILEVMKKLINAPREELSKYAPKVVVLTPPEEKIGEIIGPGGKHIRAVIAKTGTDINVGDDGKVSVSGIDQAAVGKAVEMIENVYRTVNIDEEFDGVVKRIMPFGAFVEFLPGKEGLVHVSQMGKGFVKDPNDVVAEGDKIRVQVVKVEPTGKIGLRLISK